MIEALFGKLDMEKAYELALILPELDDIEISAVLTALEFKGYDSEVLAGFAKAILERSRVNLGRVFDTCGTGGDGFSTINVSTAVSIAISNFTQVAKHGNRAISSKSGSADVLEKLGIKIELPFEKTRYLIRDTNFAFLFAPYYHKSFSKVSEVRKKLKFRTIFNVLGPLVNPANPERQIIGVSNKKLLYSVAEVMEILGRRGLVYHGSGIDEVNPSDKTTVISIENGIERITLTPEDFGVRRTEIIPCKNSFDSAERIRAVFANKGTEEDKNLIAVNFSLALFAIGYEDLKENVSIFNEKVELGDFRKKLEEIVCRSMNLSSQ
ncbi:MAG: anthranilate phosphoribosyltransferase [Archaeoglobaceae archaeon]|nr:anthranilate phosphoribosyltransferase [Archaeoglobaceae archaeon]MDW7989392.1 anthranilate phosphoribosyltransferase [Archaeoglobaceae archaeon]